jgi:hypothetical protein
VGLTITFAGMGASSGAAKKRGGKKMRKGVHTGIGSNNVESLKKVITEDLAPLGVNALILEVNYNFEYQSHPELRGDNPLTKAQARELSELCKQKGIRLIPQFQCLGHQSWAKSTFPLLVKYPEMDETPQTPKDNPGIYCRSWCPLHPQVNEIVFALMDELLDAFRSDALHVGMDEVFLIASDQCPRCKGKNPADLFAHAVNDYHNYLVKKKKAEMLMWGDRLLDAKIFSYGKWEASENGTAPAIDDISKDIVVCDWHYEKRDSYPSIPYFQEKGFRVWPAGWKNVEAVNALVDDAMEQQKGKMVGYLATVWGAAPIAEIGQFPALQAGIKRLKETRSDKQPEK